jgi:hypothetical protein
MNTRSILFFCAVMLAAVGIRPQQVMAQSDGDYRSANSGDWGEATTWDRFDGSNWQTAIQPPTSADGVITIRNGHVVTVKGVVTVDQVIIETGGQVIINPGVTWTLANGPGTDLIISGTLLNRGTFGIDVSPTWTLTSDAVYIHNTTTSVATPLTRGTLSVGSIFIYRGSSTLTPPTSVASRTYGHLFFESDSGTLNISLPTGANALTVIGNLSFGTTGSGVVSVNTANFSGFIHIGGDVNIGNGSALQIGSGNSPLNAAANFINDGTFSAGSGTVVFNGSSYQAIGGAAITSFNYLTIAGGAVLTGHATEMRVAADWINNGSFNHNDGTVTFNGSATQMIGGSQAMNFNTLAVNSGATVVIPPNTTAASLTNNGHLRQTQPVNGQNNTFKFLEISNGNGEFAYRGVEITLTDATNNNMGDVVVEIRGNQDCTTNNASQPVRRCFDIEPETPRTATIRFYYSPGEANENAENAVNVYHWNDGSWDLENGTYTHSSGADPRWVEVTGVSNYSPFVLDNQTPTAVTLQAITTTTANPTRLIFILLTGLMMATTLLATRRRVA